jgi:hypothetical protein
LEHVIKKKSNPMSARNEEKNPKIIINIKRENEFNKTAKI